MLFVHSQIFVFLVLSLLTFSPDGGYIMKFAFGVAREYLLYRIVNSAAGFDI